MDELGFSPQSHSLESHWHVVVTRLSEFILWKTQKEYYAARGINAWKNEVPSFITSNQFIAEKYANVIFNFMLDWCVEHPEARNHPFYIIELGAGSGKFSHAFLCALETQMEHLQCHLRYCHVITDLIPENIQFCKAHTVFEKRIQNKTVDFAILDIEKNNPLHLEAQQKTLEKSDFSNPIILIGNYIFDSLPQDVFQFENGKIKEALVSIETEEKNTEKIDWEKARMHYTPRAITLPYYDVSSWDAILAEYQQKLKHTSLLFPVSMLRCLEHFCALSQHPFLLLSSDNGFASLPELENLADPLLSFHGSISMIVNFHAIQRFFRLQGGTAFLQERGSGLKSMIAFSGAAQSLPHFTQAARTLTQAFTPYDFFLEHQFFADNFAEMDFKILLSYLALSEWDPYCFSIVVPRLREQIAAVDELEQIALLQALPRIAKQYYAMPGALDTLFDVAVIFHAMRDHAAALHYYEASILHHGQHFNVFYNAGVCCHMLKNFKKAKQYFVLAGQLNPESKQVKDWLSKLSL